MFSKVALEVLNLGKFKNLIYSFGERDDVLEILENGIIDSSKIPGAIPAYVSKEGNEYKARYQMSDEVTLKDYLREYIGRDELYNIVENIVSILFEAESKEININNYLLNLNNVYIDKETKEIGLVYIPIMEDENEEISLKEYIKDLLSNVKYNLSDDLSFFVSVHNYLNDENSSIKQISDFMKSIKLQAELIIQDNDKEQNQSEFILQDQEDIKKSIKENNMLLWESNLVELKPNNIEIKNLDTKKIINSSNIKIEDTLENTDKHMAIHISTNSVNLENNNYYYDPFNKDSKQAILTGSEDEEGGTILLDDEDEEGGTTLLGDEVEEIIPFMIRKSTREKFELIKKKIKVGRELNSCDFIINNNKLVGRIHAILTTEGNNYYIEDNNSTNGTFINGTKLPKMGKSKLNHGDEIKLANELFIFKLY